MTMETPIWLSWMKLFNRRFLSVCTRVIFGMFGMLTFRHNGSEKCPNSMAFFPMSQFQSTPLREILDENSHLTHQAEVRSPDKNWEMSFQSQIESTYDACGFFAMPPRQDRRPQHGGKVHPCRVRIFHSIYGWIIKGWIFHIYLSTYIYIYIYIHTNIYIYIYIYIYISIYIYIHIYILCIHPWKCTHHMYSIIKGYIDVFMFYLAKNGPASLLHWIAGGSISIWKEDSNLMHGSLYRFMHPSKGIPNSGWRVSHIINNLAEHWT